jgi:hypothetical protein
VSVWERISLFSTTVAFVLVALLIERPLFFAAAGFAALAAVGRLYAGRYPRESRVAIWAGRIGMIVMMVVVATLMLLGR